MKCCDLAVILDFRDLEITKLISVIDTESQMDEKTFFNISVNSLLFKLTAGRQRIFRLRGSYE